MEEDYRSKLELLQSMSKEERAVAILTESVEMERYHLEEMLNDWRESRELSIDCLYDMKEIRQQRRRVQQWVKRLNEAKAKLDEKGRSEQPSE